MCGVKMPAYGMWRDLLSELCINVIKEGILRTDSMESFLFFLKKQQDLPR
jgi:hypothetical protein